MDEEVDDILNTNLKNLRELATLFDFPDTAYISKPAQSALCAEIFGL
ncbi:MAG: hypothetical protein ACLSE6_04350 [Alphaproteobacteria bacterium]